MATGANLQQGRGIQVSNITPQVDLRNGEAEAWQAAERTFDRWGQDLKKKQIRKARQRGAEEGAEYAAGGAKPSRGFLSYGEVADAREQAAAQAYIAGITTDYDGREAEVQQANAHNVDGYDREMAGVSSGFIQKSDPEHAVQLEQYFNRRIQVGRATIAERAGRVVAQEANQAMVVRTGSLDGKLLDLIDNGQASTVEYEFINDEMEQQYAQRVANPEIAYSQAEADRDLEDFRGRAFARASTHHIRQVLRTEGADVAMQELQALRIGPSPYVSHSAPTPDGLAVPGNIDLGTRPTVQNPDGTVSTVRSITIEADGQAILIPTVTDDGSVVSDDDAVALYEQTGAHLGVFDTVVQANAYAAALHEDQAAGRISRQMATVAQRELAFAAGREALNSEISLMQQRVKLAENEQSARTTELNRRIDEDVATVQLSGESTDLTQEQVHAVGGNDAVVRWLKRRADATEFHNLVGALPTDNPEAAAAQIAAATDRRTTLATMPTVQDAGDLATLKNAIIQVESRGVNGQVSADPDGDGPAGGGAFGIMQVLPDTARRIAGKLGLPFDENRLRTDRAYNEQIGTGYLSELLTRYNGDSFLAVTAYHAGEGNVDGWLKSVGDPRAGGISREAWLTGVESRGNPRSAAYPRKVLAALGAGQAATAWEAYQSNRERQSQDPAGSVRKDFTVRTAWERLRADDTSVSATEAFVQVNLDAQSRARITAGNQRTLPVESLAVYAGTISAYESAGNVEGFRAFSDNIIRRHGKHGQRVMQDILEVRGDSRFAAMVGARALQQAANWQRPAPIEVAQANTAARIEQSTRAASGTTTSLSGMSDDAIRAAAGLN